MTNGVSNRARTILTNIYIDTTKYRSLTLVKGEPVFWFDSDGYSYCEGDVVESISEDSIVTLASGELVYLFELLSIPRSILTGYIRFIRWRRWK